MSDKKAGDSCTHKKPIIRELDGARWAGDLEGAPVRRRGGIVMFFPGKTEGQVTELEQDILRRSVRAHSEVLRRHLVRQESPEQHIRRDAWNDLLSRLPAQEVERIIKEQFNPKLVKPIDPELSLHQRQAIARAQSPGIVARLMARLRRLGRRFAAPVRKTDI